MWEMMNGMANGVRRRLMPRRRSGVGTMTAMLVGASVGIAAWEAMRRGQVGARLGSSMSSAASQSSAERIAAEVLDEIDD